MHSQDWTEQGATLFSLRDASKGTRTSELPAMHGSVIPRWVWAPNPPISHLSSVAWEAW